MNVLSLFDGISCARIALDQLDIDCTYYASEIDEFAIRVSEDNYPDIIRLGDVTKIRSEDLPKIDLLIGGPPCTDLSIAKRGREGLEGSRSVLFWEYIRLLRELKPKYFIMENVASMSDGDRDIISQETGGHLIMINSSLVTAQSRSRYYWTNFPVELPLREKHYLKDIVEEGVVDRDKSYCIDACYFYGGDLFSYFKRQRQVVFKSQGELDAFLDAKPSMSVCENRTVQIGHFGDGGQAERVYSVNGKSVSLSANGGGWGASTGLYYTREGIRSLLPLECERLQGVPEGYTKSVSKSQAKRALGNAFTVPVIIHLIKTALYGIQDTDVLQEKLF